MKALALRGVKKISVRLWIILFAFGNFFGTVCIQQSAGGDHMTHQSFLLTQVWKNSDFYILILLQESITSKRYFETQKNWILVSEGIGFERREKIFCASLDHTVCFGRLLWDRAHLTKCAG